MDDLDIAALGEAILTEVDDAAKRELLDRYRAISAMPLEEPKASPQAPSPPLTTVDLV
jgi:hypothetical protein